MLMLKELFNKFVSQNINIINHFPRLKFQDHLRR